MSSVLLVAANLIVSTPADSGAGSLREAIETANASPEDDIIEFDSKLAGQTIGLRTSATVPVDRDYGKTAFYVDAAGGKLTIRWDRARGRAPRLDAGGARRHFVVDVGGSLRLEGIWLTRGSHEGGDGVSKVGLAGGGAAGMGGSIFVREGELILVDALLTDSMVRGGDGGVGGAPTGSYDGGGGGGLAGDGVGTSGGPPLGGSPAGFGGGGNGRSGSGDMGDGGGFGGGGGGGLLVVPFPWCGPGCDPGPSVYGRGGDGGFGGGAGSSGAVPGFAGGTFASTQGGGGAALGGAVFVVGGTVSATQVMWSGHRGVPGRRGNAQARGVALTAVDSTVTLVANTFYENGTDAEGAVLVVARDGAAARLAIDHTLVVNSTVPAIQTVNLGTGTVTVEGGGNFIEGGAPGVTGAIDPGDVELAYPADHGGGLPSIAVTTDAFVGGCPPLATDVRGVPRPTTGCDAGAFQRATTCTTSNECANGATCEDGFCCACPDGSPAWCSAALGAPADGVCTALPAGAVCEPGSNGPDAGVDDEGGGGTGGCGCASSRGGAAGMALFAVVTMMVTRRRRRSS